MIKKIIPLLILALGIGYYFLFYPPVLLKRSTGAALAQFEAAVKSKDRANISEVLNRFLTDDAHVRLEITFFSITQQNNPPVIQEFDKQEFIAFIDNTLYPLTDYAYDAYLESFAAAADRKSAQLTFSSREWGDGNNYYGGTAVEMRFSSNTLCEAQAQFEEREPRLNAVRCQLQFRAVPKPSELGKMQGNLDVMKDYLAKP